VAPHVIVHGLARGECLVDVRLRVAVHAKHVLGQKHHLHVRRHQGRGNRDGEGNLRAARGGQQSQPAALAQSPDADALRIDAWVGTDGADGRDRIVGEHRVVAGLQIASRLAAATPVVDKHGDAERWQHVLQMLIERLIAKGKRSRVSDHDSGQ